MSVVGLFYPNLLAYKIILLFYLSNLSTSSGINPLLVATLSLPPVNLICLKSLHLVMGRDFFLWCYAVYYSGTLFCVPSDELLSSEILSFLVLFGDMRPSESYCFCWINGIIFFLLIGVVR